jgi:hypothetical protein
MQGGKTQQQRPAQPTRVRMGSHALTCRCQPLASRGGIPWLLLLLGGSIFGSSPSGASALMFHSDAVSKEWDTWVFVENGTFYAYCAPSQTAHLYDGVRGG